MMTPSARTILAVLGACSLVACNGDDAASDATTATTASTTGGETTGTTGTPDTTTTDGTTTTTGDETTTDGTTTGEPLTRVEEILQDLTVSMYQCPERIWPDTENSYRASQVLLSSVSQNHVWVWNYLSEQGDPPVIVEGPLDDLPPEWTAVFNVGTLSGAPTLGISLDWSQESNDSYEMNNGTAPWPDFATSLTFHEGFHFLSSQNDWNAGSGSRNAAYPEPWEPRYLRTELQRALYDEAQIEGSGLAAAAYWHGRLLAEHAAEMNASRSYDCTEGSAEYVSLMMSALAELGCDADDEALLDLAISHLGDGIFYGEGSFTPGREFYNLGVVAGLVLRRAAAPGWELAVESGEAPADQVVAGVTPETQPDDPELQAAVQAAVDERNVTVGAEIDPLVAAMDDPEYTRIPVLYNWIAGSFGVGGFYYLADDPDTDILLKFSASLYTPSNVNLEIDGMTSFNQIPTACAASGGGTVTLVIPTADLELVGDVLTSTNPKASFSDLQVEATTDANDLPWLCPVEAGGANGAPAPDPGLSLHPLRAAGDGSTRGVVRPRTRPLSAE
jgi:hypothetical protein